jgi:hypothetical protein
MQTQRKNARARASAVTLSVDTDAIAKAIIPHLVEWLERRVVPGAASSAPLLLTIPAMAELTGLSQTYFKNEMRAGRLHALKAGDRRVVTPEVFAAWIKALPPAPPPKPLEPSKPGVAS